MYCTSTWRIWSSSDSAKQTCMDEWHSVACSPAVSRLTSLPNVFAGLSYWRLLLATPLWSSNSYSSAPSSLPSALLRPLCSPHYSLRCSRSRYLHRYLHRSTGRPFHHPCPMHAQRLDFPSLSSSLGGAPSACTSKLDPHFQTRWSRCT
jgi:hypothetical protein